MIFTKLNTSLRISKRIETQKPINSLNKQSLFYKIIQKKILKILLAQTIKINNLFLNFIILFLLAYLAKARFSCAVTMAYIS